ncbi:hypothetical protein CAG70_03695 [Photobacterium halotolerans]|uniref:tetratricopeptide repeat protein n=1 Tax=Photobacterium halotolerans TaxID=265726 RepID=UPI0013725269|nr:SEL1-like repeat protein [Photobacterium halotolerans]NAX46104.1 hypothetical protein [Photobacterium halotolerans]
MRKTYDRWKKALTISVITVVMVGCVSTHDDAINALNNGDKAEAIEIWTSLAKKGDAQAMYQLGSAGVLDSQQAELWVKKAADSGLPQAQSDYGKLLFMGGKYEAGLEYLSQAKKSGNKEASDFILLYESQIPYLLKAEKGNSQAMLQLGWIHRKNNDFITAFNWFKKSADKGNTDAHFYLGYAYDVGQGTTLDDVKAINHYKVAAEKGGDPTAMFNLGILYRDGEGTVIDKVTAFKWFEKSASTGHINAISELGNAYLYGQGTEKNYSKAFALLSKAAPENPYAAANLGDMYHDGVGVEQSYATSFKWYLSAAQKGNSRAQYSLGNQYYFGRGIGKNYEQALNWYIKAAEQGNVQAQFSLGLMYDGGLGTQINNKQSFYWYSQAAKQGHAAAQNNLAVKYARGEGTEENQQLANEWYRKSANQNDEVAQNNLGNIYEYGRSENISYTTAAYWYARAAQNNYKPANENLQRVLKKLSKRRVNVSDTQILQDKDFESARLQLLKQSEQVYELSEGQGWTEVYYQKNNTIGYIYSTYLR